MEKQFQSIEKFKMENSNNLLEQANLLSIIGGESGKSSWTEEYSTGELCENGDTDCETWTYEDENEQTVVIKSNSISTFDVVKITCDTHD